MIKIFKRCPVVSVMILLCFFSAFVALCSGLISVSRASESARVKKEYAYRSETAVYIRSPDGLSAEDLARLVNGIKSGNIYLDDMVIYFNEIDGAFRPNLLLKQNEPLSLPPSVSGRREISSVPENGIVASTAIGSLDALSVLGATFDITEKIDSEKYPFVRNSFTMNASDFFKAFPNALGEGTNITLIIDSNKADTGTVFSEIKTIAAELFPSANVFGSKRESKDNAFRADATMENLISAGLFLFALINTVTISYYWVTVRRREIAIRKAFGASNFRVIGQMTAELLSLIGTSAVLALTTQFVIWGMSDGSEIKPADSIILAAGMLLGITIAIVISMIVPVRLILQIQPSEGVKL